jgi:hypothetical protein
VQGLLRGDTMSMLHASSLRDEAELIQYCEQVRACNRVCVLFWLEGVQSGGCVERSNARPGTLEAVQG